MGLPNKAQFYISSMTTSKITELLFGYSSKDGSVLQQQVVVVAESAGQNNLQMGSMYVCFFFILNGTSFQNLYSRF